MGRLRYVLLLVLFAVPSSASTVLYTCMLDGLTRISCCCEEGHHDPCCPSSHADGGCCDAQVLPDAPEQASLQAHTELPTPGLHWLSASVIALDLPAHSQPLAWLRPPPRHGPPLFIEKSSYLL